MTPRERMLIAMRGGQPDCVPVAPDTSNMIPCRLTGKPFWDIYLYQDPPVWQAYIAAVKHFGFDGWLHAVPITLDSDRQERARQPEWRQAIVARTDERIYTRRHATIDGTTMWSDHCTVYYIADPPTGGVPLETVGLPTGAPTEWEDVEPRTRYEGLAAFYAAKDELGDDGVVGLAVGVPGLNLRNEAMTYQYYDDRESVVRQCREAGERIVNRTREIVALRPDLVLVGASGHMIVNPEPIFRELSLPTLQEITAVCKSGGVPSQLHCCGPEYDLVRIAAEETDLDSINPLEPPPMGDCDLARVKREFGRKLSLMGNLHTTDVMLRGSRADVVRAAKQAIDAAAEGGGFILSTGDQCGRDTPDENIAALIETARGYGQY